MTTRYWMEMELAARSSHGNDFAQKEDHAQRLVPFRRLGLLAHRRDCRAQFHYRVPQRFRVFDGALDAPPGARHDRRRPAAHRYGGRIVVQALLGLAPVALVGLVADGEVEALQPAHDREPQQLAQVRGAGPETRDLAVVIA